MRRVVAFSLLLTGLLVQSVTAMALTATTFSPRSDYSVANRPINITLADVNGDGKRDIVVPAAASDCVCVLLGDGAGRFSASVRYAAGNGASWAAVGDVTGDGKLDLVASNEFANTMSVLKGDGSGRFTQTSVLPAGTGPVYVGIDRLNGDALPDLVSGNFTSDDVSVSLGNATGMFSQPTTSTAGDGPHPRLADVNADGRSDLVIADYYTSKLLVRMGDGAGKFSAGTSYATGSRPVATAVGDINKDGFEDVITTNYTGNTISVFMGGSGGALARTLDYSVGVTPTSVALSDLNADGTLDLAVSAYGDSSVSVLLGDGAGHFTRDSDRGVSGKPWGVALGDLNGDGKPDVVTSNATSSTVSVLLNTTTADGGGGGGGGGGSVSGQVTIDQGAAYARATGVTLSLTASGSPAQMMIANEPAFSGRTWQPFASTSSWSLTIGDGPKTVYAKFRDASGTESPVVSDTILLDTKAPKTTRSWLPTYWVRKNMSFTLSAADSGSGIGATVHSLTPPGTAASYMGTVTISAEGTTAVRFNSTDRAGNVESTQTAEVRIDKTPPTTLSDARAGYTGSATIRLSPSDLLSGVATTTYSLDGAPRAGGTSIVVTKPGTHTLKFGSQDNAGNGELTKTVTFTIAVATSDNLSPSLELVASAEPLPARPSGLQVAASREEAAKLPLPPRQARSRAGERS